MLAFRIRTNWTIGVSKMYDFGLNDLADALTRDRLKSVFSNPGAAGQDPAIARCTGAAGLRDRRAGVRRSPNRFAHTCSPGRARIIRRQTRRSGAAVRPALPKHQKPVLGYQCRTRRNC